MTFPESSIENLCSLGYTEDEACFLCIVATHSSYFSTRQYLQFTGAKSGEKSMAFAQKLLGKGHATAKLLLRNGRIYHLHSRLIYRAVGRQNLRSRREHSVEYIRTKLAILDFVLAHLDYRYLETEGEKVGYFCSKLTLSSGILPAKRYSGAIRHKETDRYFVDKFPLFFAPESSSPPVITFSFVDPGLMTLASFETHLLAYGTLFSSLPFLSFVYIATRSTHFESAHNLFLAMTQRAPNIDPGEQVLRYFTLRKLWEAKQYGKLNDDDLEFLNRSTKQFNDALTDVRYHQWLQRRASSDMIRAEFRDLAPKQEVTFRTELVDGQTALFQPSVARRVSQSGVTKVTQSLEGTFGSGFEPAFGGQGRQAQEK
jgi:hypothetical protein